MEKKNPNSHKLPRRDSSNSCWSDLPPDLFNSVFERLGLADFRRAGSVCRSWYSSSKRCVTKNQTPWLILFPDEHNDQSWCTLFNPEEKEGGKLYKIRVEEFTKTSSVCCLATYGSWLLMLDEDVWRYDLYIVNLFTNERFDLPCVESQIGTTKVERTLDGWFRISNYQNAVRECKSIDMKSPVFWIDEETKDYLVVWGFGLWCVAYSKNGDKFWNQIPLVSYCSDMVYKDHKLYFLSVYARIIKIFDFSPGMIPQETSQFHSGGVIAKPFDLSFHARFSWIVFATKLVVTVTGDLLKVEKMQRSESSVWSFRVYKVSEGLYEQVYSLGDEAMLFDLGITVRDNLEGFKRNSIYSNIICRESNTTQICLFNLETQKMKELPLHMFACSSARQLARARWFLPSFTHT